MSDEEKKLIQLRRSINQIDRKINIAYRVERLDYIENAMGIRKKKMQKYNDLLNASKKLSQDEK